MAGMCHRRCLRPGRFLRLLMPCLRQRVVVQLLLLCLMQASCKANVLGDVFVPATPFKATVWTNVTDGQPYPEMGSGPFSVPALKQRLSLGIALSGGAARAAALAAGTLRALDLVNRQTRSGGSSRGWVCRAAACYVCLLRRLRSRRGRGKRRATAAYAVSLTASLLLVAAAAWVSAQSGQPPVLLQLRLLDGVSVYVRWAQRKAAVHPVLSARGADRAAHPCTVQQQLRGCAEQLGSRQSL
jgi:hypothetical protein